MAAFAGMIDCAWGDGMLAGVGDQRVIGADEAPRYINPDAPIPSVAVLLDAPWYRVRRRGS